MSNLDTKVPNSQKSTERLNLKQLYHETNIEKVLNLLNEELVGLGPVKERIKEISSLLLVDNVRRQLDLPSINPGLHMSFTGSPGTGKTTVAAKMANILQDLKYVRKGHILTVTREDLVGQYIGHTAPKTKEVLKRAMGGILFIDEAYYLYKPDNERDYGSESIEILLQVMENQRTDLVLIFAGYKDKMDKFYQSNPGLSSRITNHVDFPDYSTEELVQIGKLMLEEQQYCITSDAEQILADFIKEQQTDPLFANARTIRNKLDKARMYQANRIFESTKEQLTKQDLVTLTDLDLIGKK
jgi:probable Rubsico expression protein CbbX